MPGWISLLCRLRARRGKQETELGIAGSGGGRLEWGGEVGLPFVFNKLEVVCLFEKKMLVRRFKKERKRIAYVP